MKKIILINNTDGGMFVFRGPLLKALVKEKFEVIVIVSRSTYIENIQNLGVKTYEIDFENHSTSFLGNIIIIKKLYEIIKREKPNIVHNFTHKPNILGTIAAKLAGVSNIYITLTGLGTLFTYKSLKIKFLRFILKIQYIYIIRFVKNIFFQNIDDLNEFSRFLNFKNKDILLNGSGIDLAEYQVPTLSEINNSRKNIFNELSIPFKDNYKIILFPARALKEKGFFEFYKMANFISKIDDSYIFIHAGLVDKYSKYGIDYNSILRISKENNVHYIGFKRNLKEYIIASDIVILPSYREGTPRSLIEALALDKFIITTNSPGCKETVIDNWNGYLCEKGEVNPLISKILQYNGKVDLRSRILCEKKFDVQEIIKLILNSYDK